MGGKAGQVGSGGLALGIALGVAIGAAMDNIGAGIAIGVAFGIAFGGAGVGWQRTRNDGEDGNDGS